VPAAMSEESRIPDAPRRSGARRMLNILAGVLVGVVLPVLVVGALVGHFGASAMFTGLAWGVLGAKLGGTRRMLYLAPAVGLAAGLGSASAYGWSWVALLAVLGLIAGGGIGFGWLPPLLMLPFAATFVTPEALAENAVIFGGISAIGSLYGVAIARRFGAPAVVEGERQPGPVAASVAVVLGAVLGGAAAIGVALGWTEPYWVPEPILILALYVLLGKRERIREKAIGTALGAAAAIPVAILAPPPEAIALIALAAFVLALTQLKTYWLYYGLYTFALVLALAAPAHVASEAKERGFEILAGIVLLVAGLAAVQWLAGWLAKRDPQPELAPASATDVDV
jgi:Fusaric acid resistance protein-like